MYNETHKPSCVVHRSSALQHFSASMSLLSNLLMLVPTCQRAGPCCLHSSLHASNCGHPSAMASWLINLCADLGVVGAEPGQRIRHQGGGQVRQVPSLPATQYAQGLPAATNSCWRCRQPGLSVQVRCCPICCSCFLSEWLDGLWCGTCKIDVCPLIRRTFLAELMGAGCIGQLQSRTKSPILIVFLACTSH